MNTTPRHRMLVTVSAASLFGLMTAMGMTTLAAGQDWPGPEPVVRTSCQTQHVLPTATTSAQWSGPTTSSAR